MSTVSTQLHPSLMPATLAWSSRHQAVINAVEALQTRGDVPHVIAWSNVPPPAVIAAQFTRTFFSILATYKAAPNEAYAIASHVAKAHCTSLLDGSHVAPALPSFLSALKAELPDSNSITALDYPGVEPSQSLSLSIPGESPQ
jgi:hypothetical protein